MSADDTADGAIGTQAAAGGKKMEDREEVVRMCVRRWGLLETQAAGGGGASWRKTRDGHGQSLTSGGLPLPTAAWQPLHFAALLSSPPLVSFLLTQGAAPHGTTLKGLTPYDLVADMAVNQRDEVAALLQGSMLGEIEDGRVDPPREPASHSGSTPGGAFDAESRFASSVGGGEATPTAEGAGLSARRQRMLERHRGNKMRRAAREADAADRRARQDARDGGVARALGAVGLGSAVPFVVADFERARREARAHEGGEAQGGVVLDNDADELSDSASEDEDEGGGASADEHEAHRFGGLGGIRETEDDAMFDDIDGEDAGGAERKPVGCGGPRMYSPTDAPCSRSSSTSRPTSTTPRCSCSTSTSSTFTSTFLCTLMSRSVSPSRGGPSRPMPSTCTRGLRCTGAMPTGLRRSYRKRCTA